jgi:hypothetical protein
MLINQWANKWGVPPQAVADLMANYLGQRPEPAKTVHRGMSEKAVSQRTEMAFNALGGTLWRNNVGVTIDARGVPVRYGLANISKKMNEQTKSGDQIGCLPVTIRPDHIGKVFGLFVSIEDKKAGWTWKGDAHELAQANWAQLVTSLGGVAMFVNDPQQIQVLRTL